MSTYMISNKTSCICTPERSVSPHPFLSAVFGDQKPKMGGGYRITGKDLPISKAEHIGHAHIMLGMCNIRSCQVRRTTLERPCTYFDNI